MAAIHQVIIVIAQAAAVYEILRMGVSREEWHHHRMAVMAQRPAKQRQLCKQGKGFSGVIDISLV